jgi:hypothetical protein
MESKKFINEQEKTRIYKNFRDGWAGETYVQIKGYDYMITTSKTYSGVIKCDAIKLDDNSSGDGFISVTFSPLSAKRYDLASLKATATEKNIRQVHFEGLAKLDAMKDELPEKKKAYEIKPGQVIFLNGYGQDEYHHERKLIYKIEDGTYFFVNEKTLQMGRDNVIYLKDIKEKFGIGTYYKQGDVVNMEIVNDILLDAIEKAKKDEAARPGREAAAKIELQLEIDNLKEKFDYLTPVNEHSGGKEAAKNIRIDLKRHFPDVKFSVTSDYSKVQINWQDGPTTKQVEKITDKYESHETDETGDFRDYKPSLFNKIFGGSNFVFADRSMSEETTKVFYEWANITFEKEKYTDVHYPEVLARRLFNAYEIPVEPFTIVKKHVEFGIYAPETNWQVKTINSINEEEKMVENSDETETEETFNDPNQLSIF